MPETGDFQRVAVLGGGAWGTALANAAARAGRTVQLHARDPLQVAHLIAERESRHLPGVKLEPGVVPTGERAQLAQAQLLLAVVPAQSTRALLTDIAPFARPGTPLVLCSKGIERATGRFLHEVVLDCLPDCPPAVLSGPSFALDVSRGLPTAVTLAADDESLARSIAAALAGPALRLYYSTDVVGVEIGGAAKNVLAIACGIAAGLGLGASAGAALVARGFAELTRFGRGFGAQAETLMGLSGLGDLVLTCSSAQSRNYAFGFAIGQGMPPAQAAGGKLAEGAFTAEILVRMAGERSVEMPIAETVAAILAGTLPVARAAETLLARPFKAEGA